MGLDMYLDAHVFVWYNQEAQVTLKDKEGAELSLPELEVSTIVYRAAYWRKANQIHGWFVENVQDGRDDCKEYFVSREKLKELLDLCHKVKASETNEEKAALLPPSKGFFFGRYEIDEWYNEDIDLTIGQISRLLNNDHERVEYYYHSSW